MIKLYCPSSAQTCSMITLGTQAVTEVGKQANTITILVTQLCLNVKLKVATSVITLLHIKTVFMP